MTIGPPGACHSRMVQWIRILLTNFCWQDSNPKSSKLARLVSLPPADPGGSLLLAHARYVEQFLRRFSMLSKDYILVVDVCAFFGSL
jgi:hypothetical protein